MAAHNAANTAFSTCGNCKTFIAPLVLTACQTWELEGLTPAHFAAANVGEEIYSPVFDACGIKWKLSAYLGGNKAEHAGYVSVYLNLLSPDAVVNADYTLQLSGKDEPRGSKTFCTGKPAVEGSGSNWGWDALLSHEDIPDTCLPGGVLTITATITLKGICEAAGPNPSSSITVPPPSVTSELWALLDSGAGSDVTLACGGQSVAAHSVILSMRSPVFRAQLAADSPLVAADLSAVPVPEEITPTTLRRLLEFIYSDELEPASPEEAGALLLAPSCVPTSKASEAAHTPAQAQHLLNAADHYALPRLRAICERTLSCGLEVVNAAHTLTLADQHGARSLKVTALRFVAANAVAVMKTDGWAHLSDTRHALKDEV